MTTKKNYLKSIAMTSFDYYIVNDEVRKIEKQY